MQSSPRSRMRREDRRQTVDLDGSNVFPETAKRYGEESDRRGAWLLSWRLKMREKVHQDLL